MREHVSSNVVMPLRMCVFVDKLSMLLQVEG